MLLTVGQLAKMSGISIRALHHYDARGLLVPSQRSQAGYRLYSQPDVVRLYRIQALQRLGLSLSDIAKALDRDGGTLPSLISQQLTDLDEQIARSTILRDQLRQLERRVATSDEPSMGEWLRALELLATYDRHCSVEDIQRLLTHNNDSEWPPFIADVKDAMERNIDHDSDVALQLARRWTRLAMNRFGNDHELAKKMKLAYLEDAAVQARVQAQSGFDRAMMHFCLSITMRAHLKFWARHLSPAEVSKLSISDVWARDCAAVLAEIKRLGASRVTDADGLLRKWESMLLIFAADDAALACKLEAALSTDPDLREFWNVNCDALNYVSRLREVVA
jgi:MerR family transcriptional regulator, thiopeptide resistance regulator